MWVLQWISIMVGGLSTWVGVGCLVGRGFGSFGGTALCFCYASRMDALVGSRIFGFPWIFGDGKPRGGVLGWIYWRRFVTSGGFGLD